MKIEYLRNANSGHNLKQFFLYCAFIKVENYIKEPTIEMVSKMYIDNT